MIKHRLSRQRCLREQPYLKEGLWPSFAAFHLNPQTRWLSGLCTRKHSLANPHKGKAHRLESHISCAAVTPQCSLLTCTGRGGKGVRVQELSVGRHPRPWAREGDGNWREKRGERRSEKDKKRLIGGERRERRLDEPWEVLLNCQIATSCELFNV